MQKYVKFTLVFILLLLIITACSDTSIQDTESTQKPVVYASFYPMYDFAQKAAGDLCDVRILIPDGTEPHDWEPSPRDIAALEQADLFVYSAYDFERWVIPIRDSIKNDNLMVLEATQSAITSYSVVDAHRWLYPMSAQNQFIVICNALKTIDPENAEKYTANEERWVKEFGKLDVEFAVLREASQKKILVTHGAFGYLCSAYGLEQIAIIDGSPDLEPDPARMAEMVKLARENGITTVFYEEISGARIAQTIADEIGGKIAPLSPLEGLTDAQRANGDDYFSVMRANLAALKEALL